MRDYTVLRLEVDVGPAARVLRKVPGVAVGEDRPEPNEAEGGPRSDEAPRASPGETPPPSESDAGVTLDADDEADGGLKERVPPVVREWGLLVVGVLFLIVGVVSAVLWAVKRRKEGDGDAADELATVDSFDEPVDEWRPDDEASGPRGDEEESDDTDRQQVTDTDTETAEATVLGAESSEGDSAADVDSDEPSVEEDRAAFAAASVEEPTGDDEEPVTPAGREVGSVDVAPLLGMGFLAVAAAVVKWAQRESGDETPVR